MGQNVSLKVVIQTFHLALRVLCLDGWELELELEVYGLWFGEGLHSCYCSRCTTCFKVQGLRVAWCFELQAVVGTDVRGPKLSQRRERRHLHMKQFVDLARPSCTCCCQDAVSERRSSSGIADCRYLTGDNNRPVSTKSAALAEQLGCGPCSGSLFNTQPANLPCPHFLPNYAPLSPFGP